MRKKICFKKKPYRKKKNTFGKEKPIKKLLEKTMKNIQAKF